MSRRYVHLPHQDFMSGQIFDVPPHYVTHCEKTFRGYDIYNAVLYRRELNVFGETVPRSYKILAALPSRGEFYILRPGTAFRAINSEEANITPFRAVTRQYTWGSTRWVNLRRQIFKLTDFEPMIPSLGEPWRNLPLPNPQLRAARPVGEPASAVGRLMKTFWPSVS